MLPQRADGLRISSKTGGSIEAEVRSHCNYDAMAINGTGSQPWSESMNSQMAKEMANDSREDTEGNCKSLIADSSIDRNRTASLT